MGKGAACRKRYSQLGTVHPHSLHLSGYIVYTFSALILRRKGKMGWQQTSVMKEKMKFIRAWRTYQFTVTLTKQQVNLNVKIIS